MNNSNIVLRATNLHKKFYYPRKVTILSGVSLSIHAGETVAIMGRSGEGKSTLLQLLGTLENPCQGSIEILNQPVTLFNKSKIRNRHIAFIFQSFHLLDDYTALDNILIPAKIARHDTGRGSKAHKRAFDLLEKVGLLDRANFTTKLLSGGEKQRIAIARALCNNPDIIFADEPSGNLDNETACIIHRLLLDVAEEGKSIIMVTHDPKLASMCMTQYELKQGSIHNAIQA